MYLILKEMVKLSFYNNRLFILIAWSLSGAPDPYPGSLEKLFYVDFPSRQFTEIPMPIVWQNFRFPLGEQSGTNAVVLGAQDGSSVIVGGTSQPAIDSNPLQPSGWDANIWEYKIASQTWNPLVFAGTKSGTSPHSDIRSMAWMVDGTLLETDDGGVVRRSPPFDTTTDWEPMMGNLMVMETHSIDIDPLNDQVVIGAQDNADQASAPGLGAGVWIAVSGGDGAPPKFSVVDGVRTWYVGSQKWDMFTTTLDQSATVNRIRTPQIKLNGQPQPFTSFRPTWQINPFDPKRFAWLDFPAVKESFDAGDTLVNVETFDSISSEGNFVYGGKKDGVNNPDLLIYRFRDQKQGWLLKRRLTMSEGVKVMGEKLLFQPVSIVAHPDDYNRIWVLTAKGSVRYTDKVNPGPLDWIEWSPVAMKNQIGIARTILIASDMCGSGTRHLVALGSTGIFVTDVNNKDGWRNIATGLPNTYYYDVAFSSSPPLFYLATLGRGVWKLDNPTDRICSAAPQSISKFADVSSSSSGDGESNDYIWGGDELVDENSVFYKWGLYSNSTGQNFTAGFITYNGWAWICITFNSDYEEDPCEDPNACEFDVVAPKDPEDDDIPEVIVTCQIPPGSQSVWAVVTDFDEENLGTVFDYEVKSQVIAAKDNPFILPASQPVNGIIEIVILGSNQQIVYYSFPPGTIGTAILVNTTAPTNDSDPFACLSFSNTPTIDLAACANQVSFSTGNADGYIGVTPLGDGDIFILVTLNTTTTIPPTTSPTSCKFPPANLARRYQLINFCSPLLQ